MPTPIPIKFLDMLPVPVIVVELSNTTQNHSTMFLNNSFNEIIGWTLKDIPDKNHWWEKAYPDLNYQRVVESLWEQSMEAIDSEHDSFVSITVNIMTKYKGIKRFNVNTELKSALIDGYYIVTFEEVS